MENQQEANAEIDGNVKFSKVVRGYEDNSDESMDEDAEGNGKEEKSVSSGPPDGGKDEPKSQGRKRVDSGVSGLEKYTKPLRETHAKYLQYLRDIDFDKKKNIASINVSFPLNFKKVLMLTIAE